MAIKAPEHTGTPVPPDYPKTPTRPIADLAREGKAHRARIKASTEARAGLAAWARGTEHLPAATRISMLEGAAAKVREGDHAATLAARSGK